ncbi:MAG: DUF5666 domain-containing protein [Steroidobacteraceae bacterium]
MGAGITSWSARLRAVWERSHAVPALVMSVLMVACGGGYGGGMGNAYMPPPMPPPMTGAAAASMSVGAITGFGSVHLNGLQFQTTGATINVDGKAGSQGDLRVGDVVEVKGHHDSASNMDVADDIEFRSNVQGPASAIDLTAQTLVVLGQTVAVSEDTSFDDDISPASLAGIKVGDLLQISGMPAAGGNVQATRIERKPAGTGLQVIGTAAATDTTAKTLRIDALSVDFSAATLVDFPGTGPQDGDLVEATGMMLDSSGGLQATRLELRTGKELEADTDGNSQIEGLVTRFGSVTDLDVAGRPVMTTASTAFEGGTAKDLALNARVEVEGTVGSSGVLTATQVHIRPVTNARIFAQADAVNAMGATVTVLGIKVSVNAMTRFEDHGSQKMDTFSLADVHTGDWLEIRASRSSAAGSPVTAARLDRRQAQPHVQLMGVVESAAPPNFTILSTNVATTTATQFNQGLNPATFFMSLAGKVVSVQGSWDGAALTADKVQLGDED